MLSLKGRVDFTCLICCKLDSQFAFSVGHEFVDPSFESVFVEIAVFQTCACRQCL